MAARLLLGLTRPRLWEAVDSQFSGAVLVSQVRHRKKNQSRVRQPQEPKEKKAYIREPKKVASVQKVNESEKFLAKKPEDDIWIHKFYPKPKFPIRECIIRHKEYADPSMLDNMDGCIHVNMELDMATKKKTKFRSDFELTVLLPHQFEYGKSKTIIVFCKTPEEQEKALSLGALHAGSSGLVKMIIEGTLGKTDFDFVLCTPDTIQEILPLRPVLRTKFPNIQAGTLGNNIESMIKHFTKGITFSTTKISESHSKIQVPFGKLNMENEQLEQNLQCLIDGINKERPKTLPGSMVHYMDIVAPPSPEVFIVDMDTVLQKADSQKSAKAEKKEHLVQEEKKNMKKDEDEEDSDADSKSRITKSR
ncbi:hypothetical protein CHS0354_028817 [Potamilus streckersoni]|uniref:39S ribosomal protein L1, mitochondrial n=1 Tax=Potamilus streckersoni TaxID=2493646 RepID=A0AAE0RYG0_9BIVA|nr:hypothetical protein CHS0354_028817 [Potamilus streckersoni]